jgi:RimJ/RimL family protein N-acetyltransferase
MSEFELQPTLTGKLVELRPLRLEDFSEVFKAASDPSIWEQHPEPNRYKREVFQKFFDGAMESRGAFAVIERKSGKIIGSSRYYDYDPTRREIVIGYSFLEREFWGKGYNREMKSMMLDHAFRFVDRVRFEVGETNFRSQKALRNIGAEMIGKVELPGLDGRMLPCLIFAITKRPAQSLHIK